MAHGLFSLQISFFFLCFGRLLPNCWKSRSFHPFFHWVSLSFSCSYSALRRSIRDNCWNSCNFHAFPTAGKPQFYDFTALRGPNPVSFVHCQGFLRNLSMSLHTNRWHMAYFLCNFQGFPLLWASSAKMLKKLQFPCFSHCSKASLLWSHCAQTQFLSSIAKVSCGIWAWHYIQTDGTWLIFSAIFKVFLCFGRLLPNPFNGFLCRFLVFRLL